MQLNLLIEKAAAVAGSQRALAQMLGETATHISNWKAGTRKCTANDRAALAAIAGEDAARAAIEGVLDGIDLATPKGQKASEALHAALSHWRKR
jgi:DNA-binding transcriptional regulator YdaS (Cro superfamily)